MGHNIYPQSDLPHPKTMTVGELIEALQRLQLPHLPVIYQSPNYGAFGSKTGYTIEAAEVIHLERREENCGKQEHYDEDTDTVTVDDEDYIQVFHEWTGVVIR